MACGVPFAEKSVKSEKSFVFSFSNMAEDGKIKRLCELFAQDKEFKETENRECKHFPNLHSRSSAACWG